MLRYCWPLAFDLVACSPSPPLATVAAPPPILEQRLAQVGDFRLTAPPIVLPSPAPSSSPTPRPVPPAPGVWVPTHDMIAFVSDRNQSTGCGFDIYIYDATQQTVWAPGGVNTPGDEFNPSLAHNNQWLVYSSNASGNFDVLLFDMRTQLVNALPNLNTPADEISPTINNDGTVIAYTSHEHGIDRLHLYNLESGANLVPAVVARTCKTINNPFIAANTSMVAFSSPVKHRGLDIFLYDIRTATLWAPPFINTEFDEDEPVLSPVDARIAFSTNRNGDFDVMETNLATGYTNPLVLANSPEDELTPNYVGEKALQIVFVSDRTGKGNRTMLAYDVRKGVLDTLPVSHVVGREDTFSPP